VHPSTIVSQGLIVIRVSGGVVMLGGGVVVGVGVLEEHGPRVSVLQIVVDCLLHSLGIMTGSVVQETS
jgi:hypothetical protein